MTSQPEWTHDPVPDQGVEPGNEQDECTCRRRDCDDCGMGSDDARDYDDD